MQSLRSKEREANYVQIQGEERSSGIEAEVSDVIVKRLSKVNHLTTTLVAHFKAEEQKLQK